MIVVTTSVADDYINDEDNDANGSNDDNKHAQMLDRLAISVSEGRKEMFYLTTHSTHFIYGYMASDIW